MFWQIVAGAINGSSADDYVPFQGPVNMPRENGRPTLSIITRIVRNIPASIIRDPLRLSVFVSVPFGGAFFFVGAQHRFSDKCLRPPYGVAFIASSR